MSKERGGRQLTVDIRQNFSQTQRRIGCGKFGGSPWMAAKLKRQISQAKYTAHQIPPPPCMNELRYSHFLGTQKHASIPEIILRRGHVPHQHLLFLPE